MTPSRAHSAFTALRIRWAIVVVPSGTKARRRRNAGLLLSALASLSVLTTGCAQFPDNDAGVWSAQPSLRPETPPQPTIEGEATPPPAPPPPQTAPPAPHGCVDPDPAVVATCLGPVGAVAVLPGAQSALVGERFTGRILRVQPGVPPVEVARVPVSPLGGGGLTGLALSPSYGEDQLFFVYVTTPTGNEVLRIAPGDQPKPVVTGIPRGPTGNSGALLTDGADGLLVATGDAGSPALAANPASLAGKVLRIDNFGNPAPGNPVPTSRVIASGLTAPNGLCGSAGDYWVTNQGAGQDALYRVRMGQPLGSPAWTWSGHPGVAGCAANPTSVVVSLTNAAALYLLDLGPGGVFVGQPAQVMANTYGRFTAASLGDDGTLWLGTGNKEPGGHPVSSDDRVLRIQPPTAGSAGKD